MSILDRYIFRNGLAAFLASLLVLTAVVWVSQALREVDLMTGKGQTLLLFLRVTGLTVPSLVTIIAPIALFAAILHTLNRSLCRQARMHRLTQAPQPALVMREHAEGFENLAMLTRPRMV